MVESARANGILVFDDSADDFVTTKVPMPLKPPLRHIQSVHVDSATSALRSAMNFTQKEVMGMAGAMPGEQSWYPQMEAFERFIDQINTLPAHTWLACHEKFYEVKSSSHARKEDQKAKPISLGVKILPALTGQLATRFPAKYDFIFRMTRMVVGGKTEYKLMACPSGFYEPGHRFGNAYELFIKPPTYTKVMEGLNAYIEMQKKIKAALEAEVKQASPAESK
jgi:hypothetical protein